MTSFLALASRPWGRKMKPFISLEKDRIKLKVDGKKVIVPIYPSRKKLWEEPDYQEEI